MTDITFSLNVEKLAPALKQSGIDYGLKTDEEVVKEHIISYLKSRELSYRQIDAATTAKESETVDNTVALEKV